MEDKHLNLVIELWESGAPISQIIRMLPYHAKVARQYIIDLRKKDILKLENRSNRAGGWRIVQMYKDGITNPYEIAEKLNYSISTVNGVLSKAKLNRPRPKHNYKKREMKPYEKLSENSRIMYDLLKEGKSCVEIGKILGCSKQNVFQVKKRFFPENIKNNKGDSV